MNTKELTNWLHGKVKEKYIAEHIVDLIYQLDFAEKISKINKDINEALCVKFKNPKDYGNHKYLIYKYKTYNICPCISWYSCYCCTHIWHWCYNANDIYYCINDFIYDRKKFLLKQEDFDIKCSNIN